MKVFIEDKRTGRFLTEFSQWTLDLRQAKDFKQSRDALQLCHRENLAEVCVLLVFGLDRRQDVRLEPSKR